MLIDENTYDFGLRLKALRKKYKMTQEQVANRVEVTKSAISSYETNVAYPSADILIKLATLFNTTSDYILGLDKREVIVLTDMTQKQIKAMKLIIDTILKDFKT